MTKHETKDLSLKTHTRIVLLVDDDVDFAQRVEKVLSQDHENNYSIVWKRTGGDAIEELRKREDIHVVLLEYFLPDQTGLEIVHRLNQLHVHKPVIFLSANKDFNIAVEIMKCGVKDYVVKNEIPLQSLCGIISRVYDDYRRREEAIARETTKQRIAAMKELIARIINEIEHPIEEMQTIVNHFGELTGDKPYKRFVDILGENVSRIIQRVEKLRTLNTDKTVRYIKDIRMIDLS